VQEVLTVSDFQINTPDEVWKEIPGFPGYEVSNQGRVRSYWRKVGLGYKKGTKQILDTEPQRIRKHSFTKYGYPQVRLSHDGKKYTLLVHQLVLLLFIGPCPPGMESCHNDGKPAHCTWDNLRWDTRSGNHMDKHQHGTATAGEKCPLAKLTDKKVLEIRKLHAQGYSQRKLAKMFNVVPQTINYIIHRRNWAHLP
jgi:NUMOD4 motif/Helix-turn-helix domain/HNH endonuclease